MIVGIDSRLTAAAAVCLLAFIVRPAHGQAGFELSIYSGAQGAYDTHVTGVDEAGVPFDFTASWEGRSSDMLIYYGMRLMRWRDNGWGYGIEITHAKVWATRGTLVSSGFDVLQFTDGNNVATLDLARRANLASRLKAHGGVGLGLVMPHLFVKTPSGGVTNGYQITGFAGRWFAGIGFAINEKASAFAEYAGMYTVHHAELTDGGTMDADIVTHALNAGFAFPL